MTNESRIRMKKIGSEAWKISLMMVAAVLVYYLPSIAGMLGWTDAQASLNMLHNFFGLDFYVVIFFLPVVYTAYTLGVIAALAVTILSMGALLPYAISYAAYPETVLRPTAFAIILSAVGAIVAMLQKSDELRQRNVRELKCLYEVGHAADKSTSVQEFANAVVEIIPRQLSYHGQVKAKLTLQGEEYKTPDFEKGDRGVTENLLAGGDVIGTLEIYTTGDNYHLQKRHDYLKTLLDRLSSAIREIELQHSLQTYYQQVEEVIEKRTKELELAQEKLIRSERLAAVGELASGVGHELRNPLNVIRNCAYLLNIGLEGKLDTETTNTLKLMDRQVDIANRIVSDLLDFTRVKAPMLARIDLNSLVKESLTWVVAPRDTVVKTTLEPNSPQVMIDAEQVGRAFANVIANAYQAMNGGGELRINTGLNGQYAWVSFSDTGCGIQPENMSRLFEPLFTTKPKGIGLGLAITKRLVEQNQGTIEVNSEVGQGATFTLKLPLQKKEIK